VSLGLHKKFGDLRVLDTPICGELRLASTPFLPPLSLHSLPQPPTHCLPTENSFMGMGIGAAMTGLRPIIEGMNMGFLLLAFNQISNNAGMLHYTSGGQYKTPIVIRGPGGVGKQLGAEHSQRLESYFQSIPGVQLVACSTVRNSKALLKAVCACVCMCVRVCACVRACVRACLACISGKKAGARFMRRVYTGSVF
jgi:pyruvate dehydrogenase E1 component beta subunit